jgi:hypothetical protein
MNLVNDGNSNIEKCLQDNNDFSLLGIIFSDKLL